MELSFCMYSIQEVRENESHSGKCLLIEGRMQVSVLRTLYSLNQYKLGQAILCIVYTVVLLQLLLGMQKMI